MASLPKLRPFGAAATKNDSEHPWGFTDTKGKQVPSSDPNTQYKESLLNSYLGRGAKLASFDSYNNSPDDEDSLFEATFPPSDTRCPLIAEGDDERRNPSLHAPHQDPAVLYIASPSQLPPHPIHPLQPKPFHQNSVNDEEMDNLSNTPENKYIDPEDHMISSTSLEKPPLSPPHGYINNDQVNTMSTECSSPQPPTYTARECGGSPDTMTPFLRLRSAVVGVHAAVRITRMQRLQKKAKWASKKFLVFTLSKVGLTCVIVAYVIFGAFLFQHLEGEKHIEGEEQPDVTQDQQDIGTPQIASFTDIRTETIRLRKEYVHKMWNTTNQLNVLYFDDWHEDIMVDLEEFETKLLKLVASQSQPTTTTGAPRTADLIGTKTKKRENWTYAQALLFCVAVITTIGYGDTVPETEGGKVACIFYGLVGIPIMLLCLANIGHFLAICFRFLWQQARILCLMKDKEEDKPRGFRNCKVRVPISVILLTLFLYLMLGASLFCGWEGWSFLNGCYFVFVTLSTIGFGDLVPGNTTKPANSHAQRVACALYLLFGLSLVSMIFQLMQEWVRHIMARYAEFLGLTKEQIEKDKEIGETGIDDVSMEGEGNRGKFRDDPCQGTGGGAGCSDVIAIGECHENFPNSQKDAEGPNDTDVVSVAEIGDGELQRAISKDSSRRDGMESQESLGNQTPFKPPLHSDAKQGESHGSCDSQPSPAVEEASNTLLGLFKKRRAQDKAGNLASSSGSLNRDSVGGSGSVEPTAV